MCQIIYRWEEPLKIEHTKEGTILKPNPKHRKFNPNWLGHKSIDNPNLDYEIILCDHPEECILQEKDNGDI